MKPTPKLEQSDKYQSFTCNLEQRKISTKHVKDLMGEMERFGFLPSKPIQCYKNGSKLVIIDGHHRFIAAKNLQIQVYYVVEPMTNQESIAGGNYAVKKWSLENFVRMFAARGIPEYQELLAYKDKGINLVTAAKMLMGLATTSGGCSGAVSCVHNGTFKIKSRKGISNVLSMIDAAPKNPAVKSYNFIAAVDLLMRTVEFDAAYMVKKLTRNPAFIIRTATTEQMLDSIEDLYNYHSQQKVPLAFLAKQKKTR